MVRLVNAPDRYGELLVGFESASILPRIWAHDFRVWKPDPAEITNRLSWLHLPFAMTREIDRLESFARDAVTDGFTHALLLGMGGSSLAPETYAMTFGTTPGHLEPTVLDSTHPDAIAEVERKLDPAKTLFLVATKSGTTTETLSLFRYFYRRTSEGEDTDGVGDRFVAITDPGSPLVDLATGHGFRSIFLNDPNLGGRYSALSHYGLVPAALLGIDLVSLLERAQATAIGCAQHVSPSENPAARLGAILGAAASSGRDKLTLLLSPSLASFGSWVEQLIAESTGKDGTGILPIVGEPIAAPDAYGDDRLFVSMTISGEGSDEAALRALEGAGHPVAHIHVEDPLDFGGQFFLWELATAIAAHALGVNPFDQPNVESAKVLARELVADYRQTGRLPANEPPPLTADSLTTFLRNTRPGDYVAIQAYAPPDGQLNRALSELRTILRTRFGIATTSGYGPRFLHSTGQLHKGDRGNGHFVQLVVPPEADLSIPDSADDSASALTFGTLIAAQAGGDRRALLEAGRRVATYILPPDPTDSIRRVAQHLAQEGGNR